MFLAWLWRLSLKALFIVSPFVWDVAGWPAIQVQHPRTSWIWWSTSVVQCWGVRGRRIPATHWPTRLLKWWTLDSPERREQLRKALDIELVCTHMCIGYVHLCHTNTYLYPPHSFLTYGGVCVRACVCNGVGIDSEVLEVSQLLKVPSFSLFWF